MNYFCPTIVIRHRKERLKKCSLRGLESRKEIDFYTYPLKKPPFLENYVLLTPKATTVLSEKDEKYGLLLLDATWAYAQKMEQALSLPKSIQARFLPREIQTAYPRRQEEKRGLASVEALFCAYLITRRDANGLLDFYHFKELFLEKNFRTWEWMKNS